MDNARILEWVLQSFGGVLLLMTMGLATFALKEIFKLRSDHSALKAQVDAEHDETQRNFTRVETWLKAGSERRERLRDGLVDYLACAKRRYDLCINDPSYGSRPSAVHDVPILLKIIKAALFVNGKGCPNESRDSMEAALKSKGGSE